MKSKSSFKRNPLAASISVEALALGGVLATQLLMAPLVAAAPAGGVIVGGNGSINLGRTTNIEQTSHNLAINWDSFNVRSYEKVVFQQPDASALVLNRILDQNPSKIRGSIVANGNVLLVNPRGIMFTETATVNVGGLVASGLDVSVDDFMNSNLLFKGVDGASGAVINKGVINASSAAFIGKTVHNAPGAFISADLVSLAAGDEALLTFDTDSLMGVKVTKDVLANDLGLEDALLNEGTIKGSKVLLEASVSRDLFSNAVNNQGIVRAEGIDVSGGTIRLSGSGGRVTNSGEINASGAAGDLQAIRIDARELHNSGTIDGGHGGMTVELGAEGHDSQHILGHLTAADTIAVNAKGGEAGTDSFSFAAGGHYALGEGGTVSTQGVTITGADVIDAGDQGVLQGRDGVGETFTVTGSQAVQVNDITFTHITAVDAGAGAATDSVNGADHWELKGANSVKARDITFTGVEQAGSADQASRITGQDHIGESFAITGNKALGVNGIEFTHVTAVDAGLGEATDKVTGAGQWQLNGSRSVTAQDIVFTDIEQAGSDTMASRIIGRDNVAEAFTITGNQAVSVDGIAFTQVVAVDAGSGAAADRVTGSANWSLDGSKRVNAQNITFVDVEQIEGIGAGSRITARADVAESFVVTGDQQLRVDDMTFNNIVTVNAGGGDVNDSVSGTAQWELQGTRSASARGIRFTDIEQVNGGGAEIRITGRDQVAESFVVTDSRKLMVDEIMFSGVVAVNAGSGSVADQVSGAVYWTLNGDNSVIAGGMTFSDVERVSGSGAGSTLTGRNDVAEAFRIHGSKTLTAGNMTFDNISVVNAGTNAGTGTGSDRVTGSAQWLLNGNQSVKAQDMTFHGVEEVGTLGDNSQLTGSANSNETFILTGNNRVTVSGMSVAGVGSVVGQATDQVQDGGDLHYELYSEREARVANVHLQGLALANIQWEAGDSLTVAAGHTLGGKTIDSKGAQIIGSQDADAFTITGANTVDHSEVRFTNVTRVDGLGGRNSVAGASEWLLEGNQRVHAEGITFHNIEQAGGAAAESRVSGRDGVAESFAITGSKALRVEGIDFTNVAAVDGGSGAVADSVTGAAEWQLNGSRSVVAGGMTFTDIEQAGTAGRAGVLIGRNDVAESFVITGDQALTADDIAFTHITSVDAGSGAVSDRVAGATDWALQGHQRVSARGIAFSGVEQAGTAGLASRVSGQNDVGEDFVITGEQALTVEGIQFEDVDRVMAGSGATADRVSGADAWQLNGQQSVKAQGITFTGVEQAGSAGIDATLHGRNGAAESFVISGNGELTAEGIAFTNIIAVEGGSGAAVDRVSGASEWWLDGYQSVRAGDILFTGIERVDSIGTNGSLYGRNDVSESFVLKSQRSLSVEGIEFTEIARVNAGSGAIADRVAGATEWQLQGHESLSAGGIAFTGIEQATGDEAGSRIVGRDQVAESFAITGHKALHIDGIEFANVTAVDAGGGDERDGVSGAAAWQLNGHRSVIAEDILFTNIEQVSNAGASSRIQGRDGVAESFVITGSRALTVDDMTFTDIDQIDAGGGAPADSVSGVGHWALRGHKSVRAADMTFTGIDRAGSVDQASSITGQDNLAESFAITGDNKISVDGIAFENVHQVDAGEGGQTDRVSGASEWHLTGHQGVDAAGIAFTGIERADSAGSTAAVVGRDHVAELFAVTGNRALNAEGIAFSNVAAVNAGDGTVSDSVSGAEHWQLQGNQSVKAEGITFSGVEQAIGADTGSRISGRDNVAETFAITGSQAVQAEGIAFTRVATVDAGAGAATDSVTGADSWQLNGNQSVKAEGITFTGVEQAGSEAMDSRIAGRDHVAESFAITGAKALNAEGIAFTNVTAVDAGTGTAPDSVSGAAHWQLNGNQSVIADGIVFSGVEHATGVESGSRISGRDQVAESFVITGNQALAVDGIAFEKIAEVNAGSGAAADRVTGAAEWQLNGKQSVKAQGVTFHGVEEAGSSDLSARIKGQDGLSESFLLTGNKAVTVDEIRFDNVEAVSAGTGGDDRVETTTAIEWQLTGEQQELAGRGITFSGIETAQHASGVSGYSRVKGSDQADSFHTSGAQAIIANGVNIKNIDHVDGRGNTGGNDVLTSNEVEAWQLSTDASVQVEHSGIRFTGLEEVQGAMGSSLVGTAGDDDFVVAAEANRVSRDNLTYTNITQIDGGAGEDTLNAARGHTWHLTDAIKELVANGITYRNIDIATAADATVKGRDAVADTFVIGANQQQLTTQGMTFTQVARVEGGSGAGDRVLSHSAYEWQLTPGQNSVQAAGVRFAGIEAAGFSAAVTAPGTLLGSAADETFDISGNERHNVSVNGIAFSQIGSVHGGGGNNRVVSADAERWSLTGVHGQLNSDDIQFSEVLSAGVKAGTDALSTLRGSGSDETYVLDAEQNTISVAGIRFDHLEAVDAGAGRDSVHNLHASHWRAAEQGGDWAGHSAEAQVNSVWVLFENIEQVLNTGEFSGPSMGADYTLTDAHAVRVGDMHFTGVTALHAGTGTDTLYGLDVDTDWTLHGRSGSTQHLNFTGIDTIRAGSGRDVFTFHSGVSGDVFTGGGNDTVRLNGGSVSGLYLQDGADQVFINSAASSVRLLDGGAGQDALTSNLADLTWHIHGDTGQMNYLGDPAADHYAFTGFETLRNSADWLRVNTSLAAAFALDHVVFGGAGIHLDYRPAGNIQFTSQYRGANALTGNVSGGSLDIRTAGDVDLNTRIDRLSILNQDSRSLKVNIREADNLVVGQIHAGSGGTISLTSMGMGALTAETRGVTHLTADTVNLGSEWQRWSAIGEQLIPLRMEVGRAVNIVALSYVEPEFVHGIPALTATGNRLQSVTGAVAAQGMKSAVQVNVEEFTQVDPAIFTAVSPYSVHADALNAPEYAVVAGELVPAHGLVQASGEIDGERTTLKAEEQEAR